MNPTASFTPDSARDDAFFRIVQNLFPPKFLFSASTLLASYDDDEPPYVPAAAPKAPPKVVEDMSVQRPRRQRSSH
jgi:hypothetical protein